MSPDLHDPATLDDLVGLFAGPRAQAFYDEDVTELAHALQAATLAEAAGASEPLIAAALLHDVGHLVVGDLQPIDVELAADFEHEKVGARVLRRFFDTDVTAPVALHVAAKRWLCATDAAYADALSASSVRSLAVQGGPMDADERRRFEQNPGWHDAVSLRRWDDLAKDPTVSTAGFARFEPLLRTLARSGPT